MFVILGIVIFTSMCLSYLYLTNTFLYFKKRNIPFKKPNLVFGNMKEFIQGKELMGEAVTRIYNSFSEEKVVGMFFGPSPVYVIRDPELVIDVLIRHYTAFLDHGFYCDEENEPLDLNLFQLSGTKWKILRRKLSPAFTSGKLKWMFQLMDDCVSTLTGMLDERIGKEIEIRELFCKLTTDVIGSCAFGIDSEALKNPNSKFREIGRRMMKPNALTNIKNTFKLMIPNVFRLTKLRVLPSEIRNFFINLTKDTFEYRLRSGEKRNDFIQLLLQLREKGEIDVDPDELEEIFVREDEGLEDLGKFKITDGVLAAQLFLFFSAGFETAATALSFILYLLMKHPDIQNKVREEVKAVIKDEDGLNYASLQNMVYLDACIKETMRIYPPTLFLVRKCTKSWKLGGKFYIEKGTAVYIPTHGIQTDSKYYEDPLTFKPERFLGHLPKSGTYMPFGDGPRFCVGKQFAQLEIKLTIARLLTKYKFVAASKMAQFEPIKFDPTNKIFAQPLGGVWCCLEKI